MKAATMAEDYYSVLGVPKNASQAEIQKAYRELARKHHPDMNPDDKTAKKKFQKVQAAFDVLNNPEKREMYDRYGSSFETHGRRRTAGGLHLGLAARRRRRPGAGPGGFGAEDIDLSQFLGERFGQEGPGGLGDLFGQFRRAAGKFRKPAGRPRPAAAAIWSRKCKSPSPRPSPAAKCRLTVQRPARQDGDAGGEDSAGHRGRQEDSHPRPRPAGPRGGTPGDILLTVRVQPHPYFHRRGNQLHVRVPVTLGRGGRRGQGGRAHAARDRDAEHSARHFQRHEAPREGARRDAEKRPARRPAGRNPDRLAQAAQRRRPPGDPRRSTSITPRIPAATCGGKIADGRPAIPRREYRDPPRPATSSGRTAAGVQRGRRR